MTEEMNREKLLKLVHDTWQEWQDVLCSVEPHYLTAPGVTGDWSAKDIVAHITWSENEMVGLLRERSLKVASPHWGLPWDERNRIVYEENRARPLDEVMEEANRVHAGLLPLLEGLAEEDLHDPARLGMPPEWVPWEILRGSTYQHYQEHTRDLRGWLDRAA